MLVFDFNSEIGDSRVDSYLLMLESLTGKREVQFSFSTKTRISPAGFAILACLVDKACEAGAQVHWKIPKVVQKNYPYLKQLSEMDLNSSLLPPPMNYFYENSSQMLRVGESAFDFNFIEKFEYKFSLTDDLHFDCKLILQELMQNVISHAGGERYYLYAGLWKNEIHLGVLDMGVSIPAKLQQKYRCENDLEYILLALEEGITTRRQRVGGLGLTHFKDVLKNNAGKLTMISGEAQVRYYFRTRKSQKSFLKCRLPGTWCCARIPL